MTLAEEKYILLTTFRRNGDGVATPVWIAPLGDGRAGFGTDATSGKVKRIRNNRAVTAQACSMRGTVKAGSPVVHATASIAEGAAYEDVHRAIRKKYGLPVALMGIPTAVKKLFGKVDDSVGVVLTFDDAQ
jgi:PPOX class probable F420-dependent enzyme